jgi:hypothetical protein
MKIDIALKSYKHSLQNVMDKSIKLYYFAIAISFASVAQCADLLPEGENCALKAPPEIAGEYTMHGITSRVFPRAKDIKSSYSGCQTVWDPANNSWEIFGIMHISEGYPDRIWGPSGTGIKMLDCLYEKGRLIQGNKRSCQDKAAPLLSLKPGCDFRKRKEGRLPMDCKYE